MDLQLLDQTLAAHGEPRFRARQVWGWAARGAGGYEEMTDLPSALREALASELPFSSLTLRQESRSSDGTIKALFDTADRRPIEAVLMSYRDGRRSVCLSSQSGCPLTCRFCATGSMKFGRNLSASEIVEQALHFRRVSGVALTNCVFMGMGEPMLNLDAVLEACRMLPDLGITHRRTTISTVGWIPGIEKLADSDMPVRLALSLHAPEDSLRSELMPVNDRYRLADVIRACRAFYEKKHRRVFIEYVMLAGVNDRYEQAIALSKLLAPRREGEQQIFKVNLIPFNPTDSPFQGSSRDSIAAFRGALESRRIPVTVRLTRGRDIAAACGQLAAQSEDPPRVSPRRRAAAAAAAREPGA